MKYTLSPARTSIISCNTAISKKNYLFCRTHEDLVILMLTEKAHTNALMFGLNGVGCLVQCMSVEIKQAKSCVEAGFGKLSASTSKLCKFFFCANFLSCEKIMLQLRNLLLVPQKVSLTGITKYPIPVTLSN